jgi:hypothetical protein
MFERKRYEGIMMKRNDETIWRANRGDGKRIQGKGGKEINLRQFIFQIRRLPVKLLTDIEITSSISIIFLCYFSNSAMELEESKFQSHPIKLLRENQGINMSSVPSVLPKILKSVILVLLTTGSWNALRCPVFRYDEVYDDFHENCTIWFCTACLNFKQGKLNRHMQTISGFKGDNNSRCGLLGYDITCTCR